MHTEETRSLIQAVFAAFATRDASTIAALFHTNAQWIAPPNNGTAEALGEPSGFERGADIAEFIAHRMERLYRDVKLQFFGVYADGPTGVADYRFQATLPNGAPYVNDYVFIFECDAGKVRRMREFMDTLNGRRQLFARGHPCAP
jgi:ketosteroid isomerase-like protein